MREEIEKGLQLFLCQINKSALDLSVRSRIKLVVKLQAVEEAAESSQAKCSSLEKTKLSLQTEIEELLVELQRANGAALVLEKRQRSFDKVGHASLDSPLAQQPRHVERVDSIFLI